MLITISTRATSQGGKRTFMPTPFYGEPNSHSTVNDQRQVGRQTALRGSVGYEGVGVGGEVWGGGGWCVSRSGVYITVR